MSAWLASWLALCAFAARGEQIKTSLVSVSANFDGTLRLEAGPPQFASVAWGSFEDGLNVTGWGVLNVRTSDAASDGMQHKAAGAVEGYLTARHIHTAYLNALGYVFSGNVSVPAAAFMAEQIRWAREQVLANPKVLLWQHVGLLLAQFDGLMLGYDVAAQQGLVPALAEFAFLLLNGVGDLINILPAVDKARRPNFAAMTAANLRWYVKTAGLCSALVKVTGDYEDLFMAHSAWYSYGNMDRIMKHYHFHFHVPSAANRISFSSYPGYLESLDDFYMMDSGLGMVQTTNNMLNNTLYELVKPQSLLAWQRVRIANVMARSGEEWYETFRSHASGTYVNQYMVVDFNLFEPHMALPSGLLWVIEEIPGLVVGADQTETLRRGYWPSYNVPYYPEVYKRSGYDDARLGHDGEYELAPRAKIFRRDQAKVTDMTSLKRLMRYANYSDPYAISKTGEVDISAAICMRGDLKSGHRSAGGCYDTKVTSHLHGFWNLSSEIVNGPTSTASDGTEGKSGNAPFAWRPEDMATTPHWGLPQSYAFDFIVARPKEMPCPSCARPSEVIV